jgi:hypothetical protein
VNTIAGGHAKPKAGLQVRTSSSRNKRSKITVVHSDSTEMSDLGSGTDGNGKGDGSGEGSDGGLGQESDDELDQAKLTENDAKRVLNNEVMSFIVIIYLLICQCPI